MWDVAHLARKAGALFLLRIPTAPRSPRISSSCLNARTDVSKESTARFGAMACLVERLPSKQTSEVPDTNPVSGRRLSSVICDDPENLFVRIKFHKLASLRTFLIHVVKNDTGNSPHHIQEFEGEVWILQLFPLRQPHAKQFGSYKSLGNPLPRIRVGESDGGREQRGERNIVEGDYAARSAAKSASSTSSRDALE